MDITYKTSEGRFNFRVCAIFLNDGKILAMHDERSPYYYLPGGRVQLHEPVEKAVLREVREELEIDVEIIRPLWLNQGFFVEDVDQEKFHEICVYFLMDASKTDLYSNGDTFIRQEGEHTHTFEWLTFDRLQSEYFYPLFLRDKIYNLPENLTILTDYE